MSNYVHSSRDTHTHAHTHAHSCTRTNTHTHTPSLTHTRTHTHTHTLSLFLFLSYTHTQTRSCTRARAHTHMLVCAYTYSSVSLSLTHTHTRWYCVTYSQLYICVPARVNVYMCMRGLCSWMYVFLNWDIDTHMFLNWNTGYIRIFTTHYIYYTQGKRHCRCSTHVCLHLILHLQICVVMVLTSEFSPLIIVTMGWLCLVGLIHI